MLKQIIKLCETLLKVKEVFQIAYKHKKDDFYDPSSDEYSLRYYDYEDDEFDYM